MSASRRTLRGLAYRYGRWNRDRKARQILALGRSLGARTLLLVGLTGRPGPVNNRLEHTIAEAFDFVVASGLDLDVVGWPYYAVCDGRRLPFVTDSFDLVVANAVIEHVGSREDQRGFADELARVGRSWVITTPNRWFPVEAHYHTLLTHWLPGWAPRGTVTRLVGIRGLRDAAPGARIRGLPVLSPTLTAIGTASRSVHDKNRASSVVAREEPRL